MALTQMIVDGMRSLGPPQEGFIIRQMRIVS
jgi:hypothetical protein